MFKSLNLKKFVADNIFLQNIVQSLIIRDIINNLFKVTFKFLIFVEFMQRCIQAKRECLYWNRVKIWGVPIEAVKSGKKKRI